MDASATALLHALVTIIIERCPQPRIGSPMTPCSNTVTPRRFERRLPPGELEAAFKYAFGTFGKAALHFHVERQTIARWARLSPFPPRHVLDTLFDLVQKKIGKGGEIRLELNLIMQRPSRPQRPLSGCCAGRERIPAGGW
jgi:hypothetical protein